MRALFLAEWLRLTTTRMWLYALLAAVVSGGFAGLLALVGPENFDPPLPGLDTATGTRMLLGLLGLTACVPALLGTAAVTAEYRHRTITTTMLFAPKRWPMLVAKLAAYAVGGLCYGLVTAVVAAGAIFAAAAVKGTTLGLPASTILALLARIALTMAVYTLIGAAVGALLRNQAAALVTIGAYLYTVETALLLVPGVKALYPFLPGGATAALTGFTYIADSIAGQTGTAATQLLAAPLGAAVLVGYAALAAAIAVVVPLRRDIT